jgi:hypothetical protein
MTFSSTSTSTSTSTGRYLVCTTHPIYDTEERLDDLREAYNIGVTAAKVPDTETVAVCDSDGFVIIEWDVFQGTMTVHDADISDLIRGWDRQDLDAKVAANRARRMLEREGLAAR